MPVLDPSALSLSVVAHIDDDLLFQNPDIVESIAAGGGHVTVYLTAGDAGRDESYWEGREIGAKAAYTEMAGASDWVDSISTFSDGENEYEIHTSYLESQPEVQLYFLRLPDGNGQGTGYAINEKQSLERLWDEEISEIESVDGANSFDHDQVLSLLLGIVEHHEPQTIMIQDHSSEFVGSSHSDHVHGSEYAYEALQHYEQDHQLISYVDNASQSLGPNLTPEQSELNYHIFEAYAEYDPNLRFELDDEGNLVLSSHYQNWTSANYQVENISGYYTPSREDEVELSSDFPLSVLAFGGEQGFEASAIEPPENQNFDPLQFSFGEDHEEEHDHEEGHDHDDDHDHHEEGHEDEDIVGFEVIDAAVQNTVSEPSEDEGEEPIVTPVDTTEEDRFQTPDTPDTEPPAIFEDTPSLTLDLPEFFGIVETAAEERLGNFSQNENAAYTAGAESRGQSYEVSPEDLMSFLLLPETNTYEDQAKDDEEALELDMF